MIYFYLKVKVENQINIGDQNNQQIGQNSNQSMQITEKPKTNYLFLGVTILICFFAFGVGGYYLGSRRVFQKNKSPETSLTSVVTTETHSVTTPENGRNGNSNLKTYKNVQYSITFDYPGRYVISTNPDCSSLINNQAHCLLSLTLDPTNSDYSPKAYFGFLKGIDLVDIPGQVSDIRFDPEKKKWVLDDPAPLPEFLSVWDHTRSGQEIIKSSNGGSHGSSYYYIIPDYQKDEVAIFSVPQSYRLRCDNYINDKPKETDCNNFYTSIINQYNKRQPTSDTWLPENYLSSVYSDAENIVKSYTEESTK